MSDEIRLSVRLFEKTRRGLPKFEEETYEGLHFVNPSELITVNPEYIRGIGTFVAGDGSQNKTNNTSNPGSEFSLRASVAGVVDITSRLVCVKPYKQRFSGEVGDLVVGRVVSVTNNSWKIHVRGHKLATLNFAAINLPGNILRKRTADDLVFFQGRAFLREHHVIAAEVQSVLNDGSLALHRIKLAGDILTGSLGRGLFIDLREHYAANMLPDNPDFIRTIHPNDQSNDQSMSDSNDQSMGDLEYPPALYGILVPKQTNHVFTIQLRDIVRRGDTKSIAGTELSVAMTVILGMNGLVWLGHPDPAHQAMHQAAHQAMDRCVFYSMALVQKIIGLFVINRIAIYSFLLQDTYKTIATQFAASAKQDDPHFAAHIETIIDFYNIIDKRPLLTYAYDKITQFINDTPK